MNPSDGDDSPLSAAQQLALQQFISVTNQENEAAISVLQRSEWNVQVRQFIRRTVLLPGPDGFWTLDCYSKVLRWRKRIHFITRGRWAWTEPSL